MYSVIRSTVVPGISKREIENANVARIAAAEGIVMLRNERNVLPLVNRKVAVFGSGGRRTIRGGRGSGEVRERGSVGIADGLIEAGFRVTTEHYLDQYDADLSYSKRRWRQGVERLARWKTIPRMFEIVNSNPFRPPLERIITDDDVSQSETDTVIYVVSRQAGEGLDRRNEKGDYQLDDIELINLKKVASAYDKVILVINVGGLVDLQFLDSIEGIDSILFISQPGQEGGRAVADILTGKVTPSGKLVDSWARRYKDYPSSGDYAYLGTDPKEADYEEGIYVGYRYFDSFEITPAFEFGYGLSFTDFEISVVTVNIDGRRVTVTVDVKNVGGTFSGKEVVQCYLSCPSGKLDREYQRLVAFEKTELLAPGEVQRVRIEFDISESAGYDSATAQYLLELGSYIVRVGSSSRRTRPVAVLELDTTVIVSRLGNICPMTRSFAELASPFRQVSRESLSGLPRLTVDATVFETAVVDYSQPRELVDPQIDSILGNLSDNDLIELVVGAGEFSRAFNSTPGSVGRTTSKLLRKGIPNICLVDGPAGVNVLSEFTIEGNGVQRFIELPENWRWGYLKYLGFLYKSHRRSATKHYQYCTAWPCTTHLAQTWNRKILEDLGKAVSRELVETGATLWLAPGMNIHRNPLCGRNFEYFSEDPYLSGTLATSVTRGVQSCRGVGVVVKHFCANNQETNRNSVSSNISERALREIYLQGFKIVVQQAKPLALMTSYNLVNGTYTANSSDLCTKVLRCEWGFSGLVMTDWHATGKGRASNSRCQVSGNDLIMPGSSTAIRELRSEVKSGRLDINALKRSARNILFVVLRSNVASG